MASDVCSLFFVTDLFQIASLLFTVRCFSLAVIQRKANVIETMQIVQAYFKKVHFYVTDTISVKQTSSSNFHDYNYSTFQWMPFSCGVNKCPWNS